MKLGNREVGEHKPVFIICEGGVTNYGQIELAQRQIDSAVTANADAIKFQAWKTEHLVSKKTSDRLNKERQFDWFKRLKEKELSYQEIVSLHEYANRKGIVAFATPHDDSAIDLLNNEIEVPLFKVGSGEANNYEFLKKVGNCEKPVLISFGFQNDKEIVKAVDVLDKAGAPEVIALHCVSLYPTPYHYAQLKRIEHLRKLLNIPIGISDHSVGWHVALAAVSLGICVVEKHLTFDKSDPRSQDNPGALLPEEFKIFVTQIRDVEKGMIDVSEEERNQVLTNARQSLGQCIVAAQDIDQGTKLSTNMMALKRPGLDGLPPSEFPRLIGKKVNKLIRQDEQILLDHLQ